jgi:hypothetical protein
MAPVAAVRASSRHELLTAEAHGAAPAVPGLDVYVYFIDK